jgi:hypothetical protein
MGSRARKLTATARGASLDLSAMAGLNANGGWRRRPGNAGFPLPGGAALSTAFSLEEINAEFPDELGEVGFLADYEVERAPIGLPEMERIAETALELASRLYVHLPLKHALHAAEPVQRLELLLKRLRSDPGNPAADLSEAEFHSQMSAIFTTLRDCHTLYFLPAPYLDTAAFLPFLIEECVEDEALEYVVTKRLCEFSGDPDFGVNAKVTHWNGTEIGRVVEQNADVNSGSNPSARHARGLDRLTFRWMAVGSRPPEDWVVITYEVRGQVRHLRFPWLIVQRPAATNTAADTGRNGRADAYGMAIDREGEWARSVKTMLYANGGNAADPLHGVLRCDWRDVESRPRFGLLRIFTFDCDADRLLRAVSELLTDAPEDGLIIDIRGNPGGQLLAGEKLLQLFTPRRIQPISMHFLNTEESAALAETYYAQRSKHARRGQPQPDFTAITEAARATAAPVIPSPLPTEEECNRVGQLYQGPVVLIVDALTYSTGDVFASGFQDHEIGDIIATTGQTGAGGGNPWTYEQIFSKADAAGELIEPEELPQKASFAVAVRAITRVRERAGLLLEDLGVQVDADKRHPLTRADVLNKNADLMAHAAKLLAEATPGPRLRSRVVPGEFAIHVDATPDVKRLDLYLNGRPHVSLDGPFKDTRIDIPQRRGLLFGRLLGFRAVDDDEPAVVRPLGLMDLPRNT